MGDESRTCNANGGQCYNSIGRFDHDFVECRKRCCSLCRHGITGIIHVQHCRTFDLMQLDWSERWDVSRQRGEHLGCEHCLIAIKLNYGRGGVVPHDDEFDHFNDKQANTFA